MENKTKKTIAHKKTTSNKNKRVTSKSRESTKSAKIKGNRKKLKPIMIVNYTFFVSLVLSVIFGIQTNMNFFVPFVIVLVITIVCMGIILVNAIYSKIKKVMNKRKRED